VKHGSGGRRRVDDTAGRDGEVADDAEELDVDGELLKTLEPTAAPME